MPDTKSSYKKTTKTFSSGRKTLGADGSFKEVLYGSYSPSNARPSLTGANYKGGSVNSAIQELDKNDDDEVNLILAASIAASE